MNNIKKNFSISDLENLSNVKAHTIRIWEKRYNLFHPSRQGNNERVYDISDLKKLLNISLLQEKGWKISKIAALDTAKLQEKVREVGAEQNLPNEAINQFKVAMFTFDLNSFNLTYQKLLLTYTFKDIFQEIFIPLLNQIGILWQTGTINPAHEHFISQLIENKLHINIEKLQINNIVQKPAYVLFLPENEIHNLGILYIQYELLLKGFHTIYLGHSIPLNDLKAIKEHYQPITFVTQFTIAPQSENLAAYMHELQNEIVNDASTQCWINGRKASEIQTLIENDSIKVFNNVKEMLIQI